MSKITIIGLGLVGNSIGLALKRASGGDGDLRFPSIQVVGFDPVREREMDALRKHLSVDEVAPSLESAVSGAELVIVATPLSAAHEVLEALGPLVGPDTVVTDVLPIKQPVMTWARELFAEHGGFVGGHPFSLDLDVETAREEDLPSADLFKGAPYCIMALPTTRNEALNSVIGLAELLQAKPLFIDPLEHDSFMAAASHLPMMAGATLWKVVGRSPAWPDIQQIAHSSLAGATESLGADAATLADAMLDNREHLLGWLDRYLVALQETRDTLAAADRATLIADLDEATSGYTAWTEKTSEPPEVREARARAETQAAINDARPSRNLLGTYISDRVFGKKEKR